MEGEKNHRQVKAKRQVQHKVTNSLFWSIILWKYLNQRGDSVLISCDVLSLYLQRSYLFYCKHVTANPCVCSASAERSESKHTRTGAQTSYALYACRKRPLYWPSQWLYPDLRLGDFENFAHGNSAYASPSNTVASNYTIKEKNIILCDFFTFYQDRIIFPPSV